MKSIAAIIHARKDIRQQVQKHGLIKDYNNNARHAMKKKRSKYFDLFNFYMVVLMIIVLASYMLYIVSIGIIQTICGCIV